MQNIILALAIILLTSVTAVAQCDKKVKWTAARAELLDESGNVVDTKEGTIVITTDSKNILLEIAEESNERLEGPVSENTCAWKEPFKNGKTTLKATMTRSEGQTTDATFTFEGKDGKLIVIMELEKMNGKKVRIVIDKYEEVK